MEIAIVLTTYENPIGIEESLKSILGQEMFSPKEIILVDSGSSLEVKERLRKLGGSFPNMKIILEEKNLGAGHSRNLGLSRVSSNYVLFMDAGDYLEPDALVTLSSVLGGFAPEIIFFSGYTQDFGRESRSPADFFLGRSLPSGRVVDINDLSLNPLIETKPQAWLKLYSIDFLRRQKLSFQKTLSSNDLSFHVKATLSSREVFILNRNLITYVIGHPHSVSESRKKSVGDLLLALEHSLDFLERLDMDTPGSMSRFLEFCVDVLHWKSSKSSFLQSMKLHWFFYRKLTFPLLRTGHSALSSWKKENVVKLLLILSFTGWGFNRLKYYLQT